MADKRSSNGETSTTHERISLDANLINLSDGHARQPLMPSQRKIIAACGELFTEALLSPQSVLEEAFVTSFLRLAGQSRPPNNPPLLAYSASTSIALLAVLCRQRRWTVALIEPCFDNIFRLLRAEDVTLVAFDETILDSGNPRYTSLDDRIDALWLVGPNNPTGRAAGETVLARLAEYCRSSRTVLVWDFSFRFFCESLETWDQYSVLRRSGCSFVAIEDTGKTWPTLDMKIGMTICSDDLWPTLFSLHDDLLLNVSPFHLRLLRAFIDDTIQNGLTTTVRRLVEENRARVTALYQHDAFAAGMTTRNAPFEWIRVDPRYSATRLYKELVMRGIHVLPGANFYWQNPERGRDYIRLPLNRDPVLIEQGVRGILEAVEEIGRE